MTKDEALRPPQEELEKHSLPGTNQAGTGPTSDDGVVDEVTGAGTRRLEKQTLPGTKSSRPATR
jgi:hypothetical protein